MGSRWGQFWGPEMGPLWGFWMGPRMGGVTSLLRPLVSAPYVTLMFRCITVSKMYHCFKNVSLGTGSSWPLDTGGLHVEWGKLTAGPATVRIDAQPDLFDRYEAVNRLRWIARVLGPGVQIEIVGAGISDLD